VQRGRIRNALGRVLSAYPLAVVILAVAIAVLAPQSGLLALGAVVLPHLCLLGLLLVPVAILHRHRVLAVSLGVLGLVTVVAFGPEWVSLPRAAEGDGSLTVATWNALAGGTPPEVVVDRILATDADLVALQEVTSDVADALDSNAHIATRFPHRWLVPHPTVLGMGILSAHPLEQLSATPTMIARIDLGAAGSVLIVNGHPLPGAIGFAAGIPVTFDGRARDAAIGSIRERVDGFLADGELVVVIGDYNVTPTQAGYRLLADGLMDVHVEVGNGTGWTWRPRRLAGTGMGLIRIDYVLSSPDLEPIGTELHCDVPGDHCLLTATLAIR
jgi:vancomycin resistance protein VanJ